MSYRSNGLIAAAAAAMLAGGMMPSAAAVQRPALVATEPRPTRPAVRRSGGPGGRRLKNIRGNREVARARRQHAQIIARRQVRNLVAARLPVLLPLLEAANMKRPGGYRIDRGVCSPSPVPSAPAWCLPFRTKT